MDKTFIILSSCPWGDMLQRPHHLAKALVKLGYEVHFIETGALRYDDTSDPEDRFVQFCKTNRRIVGNVSIYSTVNFFHNHIFIYNNTVDLIQDFVNSCVNEAVIIAYFPSHIHLINNLRGRFKVIYDCVDDHCDLQHSYWSSGSDIEDEYLMMNRADIVLTTSTALFLVKGYGRDNVFLSMNAVNLDDFGIDYTIREPEDLKGIPYPRVCYMGAVFNWFNEELFYRLVEANSDKSFVVIGPVDNQLLNKNFKNLYKLGVKKHAELKSYLNHMDVGIIPFKDDIDLIINCNPIKMYEYLACNLPVVSTALPDLCLDKSYIKIASEFEHFNKVLNNLVNSLPEANCVQEFLLSNTWISRAEELIKILQAEDIAVVNVEHKKGVQNILRLRWERVLTRNNLPVLEALYALTFAESDVAEFIRLARKSYQAGQTAFTLRIYVFALCLNNLLDEAVEVLRNTTTIQNILKAELVWAQSLQQKEILKFKLLQYTNNHGLGTRPIEEIKDINFRTYEVANYLLLTGKEDQAFTIYNNLKNSPPFADSPFLNKQLSLRLSHGFDTYNESRILEFKSLELIDKYLEKENRVKNWVKLFSNESVCDLCGGKRLKAFMERPDRQKLVICSRCGLTFLKTMPRKEDLDKICNLDYFNDIVVEGSANSYNEQDLSYIFKPKLQWMENNLISKNSRKLLDIGCSNGQFLELARDFGWQGTGIELTKQIKLEDNFFDCITLWDVLEHYLSPINELREIYRILKPNGQVFISTPNHLQGITKGKNWFGYNASFEHLYYFEPNTLIRMLTKVGFKIDECLSYERGDWEMRNPSNQGHILLVSARK